MERIYVNDNMSSLYQGIIDSFFYSGYAGVTVEIDVDWRNIRNVDSTQYESYDDLKTAHPTGSTETVYVVGSGDPYYIYLWDGTDYVKTKTYSSNRSWITTTTKYATITFKDAYEPDTIYFELFKTGGGNSSKYTYEWTTYGSDSYVRNYVGNATYSASVPYMYTSKGGIIIQLSQPYNSVPNYRYGAIRIVNTNSAGMDPLMAFLTPTTSGSFSDDTSGFSKNIRCLCKVDVTPYSSFTMSMRNDTHYQVVPMLTNSPASVVRYTEKSGFLTNAPSAARGQIKRVAINGKMYLTDGYFAIEDGEIDG